MSIRLRLTLWYSGLLALALAGFGLFLFLLMNYYLHAELDGGMHARARELVGQMSGVGAVITYPDLNAFSAADTYIQIWRLEGGTPGLVERSRNLGTVTLPLPQSVAPDVEGNYTNSTVEGVPLRVHTLLFRYQDRPAGLVQVARTLWPVQATLARLRLVLLFSAIGVLALAGCLGWLLAAKALRPIAQIAAAADAIGESADLGQRVQYTGPPDELGELAGTFNEMLDRLEASHRSLAEAYVAQRRFVADASHELRTPLTIIRGNVDLLLRTGAQDEALADIASETERMGRMIGDLLALARADAGLRLDKEPLALQVVLTEAERRARRLAADQDVELTVDVKGAMGCQAEGSREHLLRMVVVLLDNAIKYTPAGGKIRLAAEPDGDGVRITVTDTGPGIAPEHLPHIFERFYRAGRTGSEGTGLGLPIAKWVAEEHGGRISVVSRLGEGSSFQVWLPTVPENVDH